MTNSPNRHQQIEVTPAAPHPMQQPASAVLVVPPFDSDADDWSMYKNSRAEPRRVRFDEQLTGVFVPSHHDLSREARQNIWYSKADISKIRLEILQDRGVIRRHQLLHDDRAGLLVPPDAAAFTSRGIEHLVSPRTFETLLEDKTRLIREVLEEQHRYKRYGGALEDVSFRLAVISSSMSAKAAHRAIAQGAADEAFVDES